MKHINITTPQFVCFNQKTGQIFSIGPSIEEGYQYIEVTEEQIEPIKSLRENMNDYIVAYNRKVKKFVLKKNIYNNSALEFGFAEYFTEILPVDESIMYDILLTVDKVSNRCYINTMIELLDTLETTNIDLQKEITFSFTKKGDPHILYDSVSFNIADPKEATISIKDDYSIFASSDIATCMYKEI